MALAGEHTKSVVTTDTLLYKVRFHYLPPEAPIQKSDADLDAIVAKLRAMDGRSQHGAWTFETLQAIEDHSALRASDLMRLVGRDELLPFKTDVRSSRPSD